MSALPLHDFHQSLGGQFVDLNGQEAVASYGHVPDEYAALRDTAAVLDLGSRGRLCLTGSDRQRFINGQVTNNVGDLRVGEGCYAALVTAKGRMVSDLNIFLLADEVLLDFEPGLTEKIVQRLEKYIVADDVQVVDVSPHYGLLSVQGPQGRELIRHSELDIELPEKPWHFCQSNTGKWGEIFAMHTPRTGREGFDLFVPTGSLRDVAGRLANAAGRGAGRLCGWHALEIVRIEAGIPRFGADMDESNLPPEAGLEARAISYTKGCYIGQEVIARIRTYGQVAKALRGLRLGQPVKDLPVRGEKLFRDGKEVGSITSAVESPALEAKIALSYVRREASQTGTELIFHTPEGDGKATIVELPFRKD